MSTVFVGDNFDILLKLVVIGDSGVGKTNLLSRFQKDEFTTDSKATIGVQFSTKTIKIDNCLIKAQIWDTAGQERFRAITQAYYNGASGALIVFDLTVLASYQHLDKWIKQLRQNSDNQIICILVGNKCDMLENRCISQQQAIEFAEKMEMLYLQTSALEGTNVHCAFLKVIEEIYNNQAAKGPQIKNNSKQDLVLVKNRVNEKKINLKQHKAQKQKGCCN